MACGAEIFGSSFFGASFFGAVAVAAGLFVGGGAANAAAHKTAVMAAATNQPLYELRMAIIQAHSPASLQSNEVAVPLTCGDKMRLSKGRGHS
jgi:hypothetical protein